MFSGAEKISSSSHRDQAAANNVSKSRPYQGLLQARSPLRVSQLMQAGDNVLQAKGNDGVPVNDDPGLEKEADIMGQKAIQAMTNY